MAFSLPRLLSKLQSIITIDVANNNLVLANSLVFPDGTRQTTAGVAVDSYARSSANAANGMAVGAYATANSAQANTIYIQGVEASTNANVLLLQSYVTSANANIALLQGAMTSANANIVFLQTINNTQNTNITAVNQFAQGAYNKANSALANATGTFAGDLTITGNTTIGGNVTVTNIIGTTPNTYIVAGSYTTTFDNTGKLTVPGPIVFADTTSQNTAFTGNGVDSFARTTANTAGANTVYLQNINNIQNTSITAVNNFAQGAYNLANTSLQLSGSTQTVSSNVVIQGNLSVTGNVSYTGNVTSVQISGNTGQFFGYAANGYNALYAGIPSGYFLEPQMVFQVSSNFNGYSGLNMQNINSGSNSSSDLFITSDNGTVNDGFLDLGFASSTYNYPGYTLIGKNDGYLFATGNTTTGGGNMIIGTGLPNDIIFATGGINTTNEVMRITAANNVVIKSNTNTTSNTTGALTVAGGVGVKGNVYATNVFASNDLGAGFQDGAPLGGATNPIIYGIGNANSYVQNYVVNYSTGLNASADWAAYPSNGNDASGWIDMGITGPNYAQPGYNTTGKNEGYILMSAPIGSGTTGNLIFATDITGTYNSIEMYANGFNQTKGTAQLTITKQTTSTGNTTGAVQILGGLGVKGNVATDGIIFADGTRQITAGGSGGSSSLASWTVINSNYTVGNNIQLLANSTGGTFTITLPASPVTSNVIVIADGSAPNTGWSNNNVLVNPNGKTIEGIADNLALNISQSAVTLIYDGSTWQVVSTTGPQGAAGAAGPQGPTGNTGPQGAGANATQTNYRFNATNNQTIFVGADAYGQTLSYNVNAILVHLNGVFLRQTEDYFANNGTTITLTSPTVANDTLDVVTFQSMSLTAAQNTITPYVYTASNNQTSFGGPDINGNSLNYNINNLFVTLNGLTLRGGVDYLQSNTSYIQLTSGANANDELSIISFGSFTLPGTANTISNYFYTANAGQTSFSGADINGNSLNYNVGNLIVTRNGSHLRLGLDYTAGNGTVINLNSPAYANDEIGVLTFTSFNAAANGYTQTQANALFLTQAQANAIFATTANTYTQAQANTKFATTGKAIAMAIVFGG